jgi:hypothetical protein
VITTPDAVVPAMSAAFLIVSRAWGAFFYLPISSPETYAIDPRLKVDEHQRTLVRRVLKPGAMLFARAIAEKRHHCE